jgi:signal transduction histidine kinase
MNSLIFYIITHFITAAVSFLVAIIVWSKNKKNITHITLSLFSLSVFFWAIFYSIWLLSNSKESAFFWARALNLAATFIPIFLFHWILCFLDLAKKRRFLIWFYYFVTLVFSFFSYSEGYIKLLKPEGIFPYWPKGGFIYLIFIIIVWLPIFLYSFFLLIKEIKKRRAISQQQVIYVLIGLIIGFLGGSTNYLLVFDLSEMPPVLSSFVIFFPVFFSYSIIRYRLMNIKFILRSSSVYLLSLTVIFGLASGIKILAEKFFPEFSFWIDLMVIFFAVSTFPPIKKVFFRWANEYFFTSLYDSGKLILKTGNDLKTFLNIEEVYGYLFSVLSKNLHTRAFGVLTYDKETKKYLLQYNQGFKVERGSEFDRNSLVEAKYIANNEIVITEELKNLHYNEKTKDLVDLLERLEVELLIPLKVKGNLIGLLALGQKETEEAYNDEDLQVLEIISGQAAVAIENAQLYSRVKRFNIRLKKEVKEAVSEVEKTNKDLSQANRKLSNAYKKLKQLDSAKNEFISIASHQLRTPLTSIKGFISMIMEGDYGKVDKEAEDALKKIFISNERLIKLVNDLLSLSRIESGKFSFTFKKGDIVKLVKDILGDFKLEAKTKNIKFKFIKAKKEIKPFVFDPGKIHEVISNLVDNALKYTEKGEIKVKMENLKEKVRITVSDSGQGMSEQELEYVFEKFRRGIDSSSLNTEGTGLGLYVCRKIVDAHKGKIYAESDGPGKGSRFILELRKDLKGEEEK